MIMYWYALIVFSIFPGCGIEVADCYCLDDGRPGIDPEAMARLLGIRGSGSRLVNCSLRSTAGSPKASTCLI
jgi:hypothetical protein